jgi:hypothetical protein
MAWKSAVVASEKQYGVFKSLYDDESHRFNDLMDRAKTFISVMTLFSGLLLIKGTDLDAYLSGTPFVRIAFTTGAVLFVLALLSLLLATRIRPYEAFADPEQIIESLPADEAMSDEDFFDDRIAELSVVTNRNALQNDNFALTLTVSSWFLIVATATTLLSLIGRTLR